VVTIKIIKLPFGFPLGFLLRPLRPELDGQDFVYIDTAELSMKLTQLNDLYLSLSETRQFSSELKQCHKTKPDDFACQ
jgi:hypothetical protein